MMGGCALDSCGSAQGQMETYCEHNEPAAGSVK